MNAPISLKPFESETKLSIWAIDNALPWEPCGADAFGAPSKKNAAGTCRMWEICCNRLAEMRLVPLSKCRDWLIEQVPIVPIQTVMNDGVALLFGQVELGRRRGIAVCHGLFKRLDLDQRLSHQSIEHLG